MATTYSQDARCNQPCCSGLFRTEKLNGLPQPNVSNQLHPLFESSAEDWHHAHQDFFQMVKISLRLATTFVQSPDQLPFWHALVSGHLEVAKVGLLEDVPLVIEPIRPLSDIEEAWTHTALARLATFVNIGISSGQMAPSCSPRTLIEGDRMFQGERCKITIPHHELRHLRDALQGNDLVLQIALQVEIAVIVLHELAHAARIVSRPRIPNGKYYFSGQSMAEEGYEWEAHTLGGVMTFAAAGDHAASPCYLVNGRASRLKVMLTLLRWPCWSIAKEYIAQHCYIVVRGKVGRQDLQWQVDFESVAKLLTTRFWDEEVPRRGRAAFQLERGKGCAVL